MQRARGRHNRLIGENDAGELRPIGSRIAEYLPFVLGGTMLVGAFAFAGHYMGQNASAHNLANEDDWADVVSPSTTIFAKGSLLPSDTSFDIITVQKADRDQLPSLGKSDPIGLPLGSLETASLTKADKVTDDTVEPVRPQLVMTPSIPKLEQTFKLKSREKQKVIAQRRVRLAEENCLARAVYFEARSESELGQLAVAKVILNRVRDPSYPNTICGVVYQGSDRRNSCQFSFACDGLPDDVKYPGAWAQSKRIAQRALDGDKMVKVMSAATHYHADYVSPKWSRSMKRLIKIGRHVFYSDT